MGMTVKEMITMTEGLTRNEVGFPLKTEEVKIKSILDWNSSQVRQIDSGITVEEMIAIENDVSVEEMIAMKNDITVEEVCTITSKVHLFSIKFQNTVFLSILN